MTPSPKVRELAREVRSLVYQELVYHEITDNDQVEQVIQDTVGELVEAAALRNQRGHDFTCPVMQIAGCACTCGYDAVVTALQPWLPGKGKEDGSE